MENIQSLTIDIMNNKYTDYIYSKQYDKNRIVDYVITENGKPLNPNEIFCTFIMKYNDVVAFEFLERTEEGKFRLILTHVETFQYGRIPYQLLVTSQPIVTNPDGSINWDAMPTVLGSVDSILLVEKCVINDDDIASEVDPTIMDKLIDTITKSGAYIEEARHNADIAERAKNDAAEYLKESKSYAVGGTDFGHEGVDDDVDNAKYYYEENKDVYEKMTKYKLITLERYGWEDNLQTITVDGIEADESRQLIAVVPQQEDINAYIDSGIVCIHQDENELTFRCEIQPKKDIKVYICTKITEEHKYSKFGKFSNFIVSDVEPIDLKEEDYWIRPYE